MRSFRRLYRGWRILFSIIIGSIALYACLCIAAKAIVRSRLHKVVASLGARIDPAADLSLDVELVSGAVRITGLGLLRDELRDPPVKLQGRVDTLFINGLSYWSLFRGRARLENALVRAQDLSLSVRVDTASVEAQVITPSLTRIAVDSLDLGFEHPRFEQDGRNALRIGVASFRYHGAGITADWSPDALTSSTGSWTLTFPGERTLRTDSLIADLHDEQCVELNSLELDQARGSCTLRDLHFGPYDDLERFARSRKIENDVADCRFPKISIEGLHIQDGILSRSSARSLTVEHAEAVIYRDKTKPDGAQPIKPLVARILRKFPIGSGLDSIVLRQCNIVYHERAALERGFGRIPFTEMDALVLGARNAEEDTATCTVRAFCRTFGNGRVDFHFNTRVHDTTDLFHVEARIGRMAFAQINGAFGPLLDMQTISGGVDTIVMRMDADDRAAHGKVRLAYHDLRVVQGEVAAKSARSKPLSVLMNAVIKNDQELGDTKGTDAAFTIARGRDRSIFNYLWSGLREGSKKVLLPAPLVK